MKHQVQMTTDRYMESYFKLEANEKRLKKNKQAQEGVVSFAVLTFTVFFVTLAVMQVDVWVPALQRAVYGW